MAPILRVKLRWAGFQGAPGYSIFHFRDFTTGTLGPNDPQDATLRVEAFADAVKGLLPGGSTLQCDSVVEEIEETTGALLNLRNVTRLGPYLSSAAGSGYSAASGAVINWRTNSTRKNRRVKGRTFMVPLNTTAYEGNGSLASGAITTLTTAAAALAAQTGTPDLGVWARPTRVLDPVTGKPTGEVLSDGAWFVVSGSSVPDMAAVLRSRRD